MAETVPKRRPQFRNIHVTQIVSYRLPIAGIMSILPVSYTHLTLPTNREV